MNHSPLVSVLIPTYNYAQYLDEAIQSVLSQTYKNFELIIVDNRSTDNTDEVVKKYLADQRISYYKNDRNLGLVGNWNKCVSYAKGEYVKFLMSDDKFKEELLEEFVDVMKRYPNVAIVTSNSEIFGARSKIRISEFIGLQNGKDIVYKCLKQGTGNLIGEPTTVMFRKKDLDRVGEFKTDYTCLVDLNMWLRLLDCGDIYFMARTLSFFRVHNNQQSSRANVSNWIDEYHFYKDVQKYNTYQLEVNSIGSLGLESVIKDRALHCANGMYSILPRFFKGNNPSVISKAFIICTRERLVGRSFVSLIKKQLH